jgi:hypothetical protein
VPESILEAIRKGMWEYEPPEADSRTYDSTEAIPGSTDKLSVLAERVRQGLPLWHPQDRRYIDENDG